MSLINSLILINDPSLQSSITQLDNAHFKAHLVADREEGLQLLNSNVRLDIAILDFCLLGTSARDFLAHLRVQAPQALIIFLFAPDELVEVTPIINTNTFFRVFIKPYSPSTLLECINEAQQQLNLKNSYSELSAQVDTFSKVLAKIEFDKEGTILSVNEVFCNIVGYGHEELIDQNYDLLVSQKQKNSGMALP